MTNNILNENELKLELRNFTGDFIRYRHPFNQVVYTPGVRHLAERAEAFWLIDAIASWIGSTTFNEAVRNSERIGEMHFWQLDTDQEDKSAMLFAVEDSGMEPFISQSIPFTDFPLDKVSIWAGFDGQIWTLYLPSEH